MDKTADYEATLERMNNLLKSFTQKLRIGVCLTKLVDHERVNEFLSTDEICLLGKIFKFYDNENNTRIETDNFVVTSKLEYLLEILYRHPNVEYLLRLTDDVSPTIKNLLRDMQFFISFVEKRLRTTPQQERDHDVKLREAHKDLKESTTQITLLQDLLEDQKSKFNSFVEEITTKIEADILIIESIKKDSENAIAMMIKQSEDERMIMKQEHSENMEALQMQIDIVKEELEKTKRENDNREKDLRKSCLQAERQCLAVLDRYDTDIGANHRLMKDLTFELNTLKDEEQEYQNRLKEQSVIYERFKDEREAVVRKAFEEKVDYFRRNHAAKIIQKGWRRYRERMAMKKKKKSRKK